MSVVDTPCICKKFTFFMQLCAKCSPNLLFVHEERSKFSPFFYTKGSTILNFPPMINNFLHGACKTVQICIRLCTKRSKIYSVSCKKVYNLELLIYTFLVIYAKRSTFLYSCVKKGPNFLFSRKKVFLPFSLSVHFSL